VARKEVAAVAEIHLYPTSADMEVKVIKRVTRGPHGGGVSEQRASSWKAMARATAELRWRTAAP
jgi:hypothetical protein